MAIASDAAFTHNPGVGSPSSPTRGNVPVQKTEQLGPCTADSEAEDLVKICKHGIKSVPYVEGHNSET